MKEKKIFDAITNVPDELIKEAGSLTLKKKRPIWQKWTAMVACAAIILGIGLLIPRGENDFILSEAIIEVIYPKAFAFDNYDARRSVMEENPVDDSILAAFNDFTYRTGSLILTDSKDNVNYSPISLYYALSLAASGARNETEEQLLTLLGAPDNQFLSEQMGNLYRILYTDNEIGKLKIANSIWLAERFDGKDLVFKDSFVEGASSNFYASSHIVDFSNEETGKAMANWIASHTNGTLSPDIKTNPDQILSILNTVYFYDQWVNRFDESKTSKAVFHLSGGGNVKTDFMNSSTLGNFEKGNDFTRAGLTLKNAGQMVFILPDEGVSPYDLLSSPEKMREAFESGEEFFGQVIWQIPKFSFSSELELTEHLKALGLTDAFTSGGDFTGITDEMAFINSIRQETHISIDEKGVEASAYTQIDYAGSPRPDGRADMILDRPFIYGIKAHNGSLLFVGVCNNPAQ